MQALPLMKDSPPLFVDKLAKPVSIFTPSKVPVHWSASVKAGLDRDERLGVIERVPVNEPVSWTMDIQDGGHRQGEWKAPAYC